MEDFKKYQKKDLIKENYAKSKHIPFLAIPYTLFEDGSIKDYLDKNLLLLLDI